MQSVLLVSTKTLYLSLLEIAFSGAGKMIDSSSWKVRDRSIYRLESGDLDLARIC